MLNKIIEFSIRNKFIIGLFVIAWIGLGIWSMQKVPIDATPDITDNQVQIITQAPNLSTEDIEQFVTFPVELAMSNLPEVEHIRSISRFGLSVVTVVFKDKAGTYLPRQLVSEKLADIEDQIPQGFGKPEMGPITTGLGEIYQFTLEVDSTSNQEYSLTELREIQNWIVSRQMALVPGVVEVNSFGGNIKQYEVAVNPDQINALGITLSEVFEALEKNNQNTGGAYIEKNHQAYFIRGEGLAKNTKDLKQIVIKNVGGNPITIQDVAQVDEGKATRYGALTKNGTGEAVGGMILMLKGANSHEVIDLVKERMIQIENSLPEGVKLKPFIDRSELIDKTTNTIAKNLIEGGLIVIFILVLFLGNWRGGLIVASAIPLSLLFAFIMMHIFDVWANLMSLGALDFGIIVDGAVIIVEATVFKLFVNQKKKTTDTQKLRDKITLNSAKKMMNPAFFGQLIIIIVFIPILLLEGIEGKMFKPMALTFVFAMLGAMILCLTYIPAVSALFIRIPKTPKKSFGDKIIYKVENFYKKLLIKALEKGKILIIGAVVVLGISLAVFSRLGGEFIPQLDEGDIAFHAILKPGSSLTEAVETTTKIEKIVIEQFPEVEEIVSRIGVADVPTDPMPMDLADVIVRLKPEKEWVSAKSKEELIEKMKEAVSILPGVSYEFTQPIEMRFNELLTGVREDVAIKIFGEDLNILAEKAQEIEKLIADVEGIGDMSVEATSGLPQINIEYDRNKLAKYGVDIASVNKMIQTAFAGGQAGVIFEGEKRFDLMVRLSEENRKDLSDLENLYVATSDGNSIPLKELASVGYQSAPMQISRENTNRRTYVGINIRNRDVKSVVDDIQNKLKELKLPPGYYLNYGGTFENYENAKNQLKVVVPAALILIFMLIYFALKSFKETAIIYLAIPMSVIGGVFALWLRGMDFSISAGVGFIVLFGVAVMNGLVLLTGLNELKEEGVTDLNQRIITGSVRRVRPILLTALVDIFGFLPMAISTSAGAEVQRPLATVVIGGLFSATLLTLFVLPVLYKWLESKSKPKLNVQPKLALLFIGLFIGFSTSAQENPKEINMEEAVKYAKENHYLLKNSELKIEQEKVQKSNIWDFGETEIFTGGEEIKNNTGIYTLVGIGQQNIDLLGISAKKKTHQAKIEAALAQKDLTVLEVEQEVKKAWMYAFVKRQEYRLYQKLDSIYKEYKNAAHLNYEVELISRLAYNEAKKESLEANLKREQAFEEYQLELDKLNLWFSADSRYEVSSELHFLEEITPNISIENHPELRKIETKIAQVKAEYQQSRSERLPKFNVEYGIQRLAGDNGYFSYQAGVSVPLFSGNSKAEKRKKFIAQEIVENEENFKRKSLEVEYQKTIRDLEKWKKAYSFYKEEALPLAIEQEEGALLAYQEGAIGQTTFSQILSQAVQTRLAALESLENYLLAVIATQYFENN